MAARQSQDGSKTPGIDKATAAQIETWIGVEVFLDRIRDSLKSGEFRPVEVRQVMIPKKSGKLLLAATLFAHDPAGFDVHVPAGLGGDVLGLGRPGEAGEQALLAGARPPGLGPAW